MSGAAAHSGLVLVAGPTAAGKSAVAELLADRLQGEIVSADALQVYRGMDVGTAKPPVAVRERIPHHCIDILDPDERCTAGSFARRARAAIAEILARGRPAILVGGSGFYVSATLEGLDRLPRTDARWRRTLLSLGRRHGSHELHRWLCELDPAWAARIDAADLQRLVRALEVVLRTGLPLAAQPGPGEPALEPAAAVALDWPREELYARIEARVDRMLAAGWLGEVQALLADGLDPESHALQAIGYRELASVVHGERTLAEAREDIVRATRRYAKRQIGWFRRDGRIRWFPVSEDRPGQRPDEVRARIEAYVRRRVAADPSSADPGSRLVESD